MHEHCDETGRGWHFFHVAGRLLRNFRRARDVQGVLAVFMGYVLSVWLRHALLTRSCLVLSLRTGERIESQRDSLAARSPVHAGSDGSCPALCHYDLITVAWVAGSRQLLANTLRLRWLCFTFDTPAAAWS